MPKKKMTEDEDQEYPQEPQNEAERAFEPEVEELLGVLDSSESIKSRERAHQEKLGR